jgi:aminobenzoyl-glutamate transport protein
MKRFIFFSASTLIVAQLLLVLVSWLLSATTGADYRSLLSEEGVRWYVSHFSELLLTPLLSWLLLLSMTGGCLLRSGLLVAFRQIGNYRERLALLVVFFLLALYIGVVLLLTVAPHAVLLSATGYLWPSPFSRALVPLLLFGILLASAVYGFVSHTFLKMDDVFQSLVDGLSAAAPLFLFYVLIVQFYKSLCFVFF